MKGRVIYMKYKKHRYAKYYRKQKILGAILAVLGIISAIILDGDITVALIVVPVGLYIIFTDDMVLLDDYFYEEQAKNNDKKEH